MLLHQFGVEPVVAGGHRGVGGENGFAGNPAHGMIKTNPFGLQPVTNRLQNGKSAMALIQMQNAGGDAHGLEGSETSDRPAAIPGGCGCASRHHTAAR